MLWTAGTGRRSDREQRMVSFDSSASGLPMWYRSSRLPHRFEVLDGLPFALGGGHLG
eukprot:SAG31_NODE_812_length_11915_cov_64.697360_15_plen_57_part_00